MNPNGTKCIKLLGKKLNKEKQAKKLISEHEEVLKKFQIKSKGNRPKAIILMGLPGSYMAATEKSYVGDLVKLAGGDNVYKNEEKDFVIANTEDMKGKNPDIIFRTAHAMPEDVMKMFEDEFKNNQIWKHFQAVKDNRVYDLDSELFGMSARFNYSKALEHLQGILYEKK